jgi:hypothetical protein
MTHNWYQSLSIISREPRLIFIFWRSVDSTNPGKSLTNTHCTCNILYSITLRTYKKLEHSNVALGLWLMNSFEKGGIKNTIWVIILMPWTIMNELYLSLSG